MECSAKCRFDFSQNSLALIRFQFHYYDWRVNTHKWKDFLQMNYSIAKFAQILCTVVLSVIYQLYTGQVYLALLQSNHMPTFMGWALQHFTGGLFTLWASFHKQPWQKTYRWNFTLSPSVLSVASAKGSRSNISSVRWPHSRLLSLSSMWLSWSRKPLRLTWVSSPQLAHATGLNSSVWCWAVGFLCGHAAGRMK